MTDKRKFDEVDAEQAVSLQDVINEDEELQETAKAVLGASDDKHCTYPEGYIKRQALFACSTCSTPGDLPGGVCLACSLECHDGHELYELYTKRSFRCDCGNAKFPNLTCKLVRHKENTNENNLYNHNFCGLYCTCNRPYPDEDNDVDDEMIQCVVCEDWLHGRHLGQTTVPTTLDFAEMICFECMQRCTILQKYSSIFVSPTQVKYASEKDVDVETLPASNLKQQSSQVTDAEKTSGADGGDVDQSKVDDSKAVTTKQKEEISTEKCAGDGTHTIIRIPEPDQTNENSESSSGVASSSGENTICKIKYAKFVEVTGATFWPDRWRCVLCTCKKCLKEFEKLGISFLLDEADTVKAYEDKGKTKLNEISMESSSTLRNMSRMQQVEMIQGYNDMKGELAEYLRKFANSGKIVTAEDINTFFQQLQNKRQRTNMSYNCH